MINEGARKGRPYTAGLHCVNRALADGQTGFLHRFSHRGMRVNRTAEILGAAAVFHVRHDFTNQLSGIVAQNLRA
jgi:hypothetical protein